MTAIFSSYLGTHCWWAVMVFKQTVASAFGRELLFLPSQKKSVFLELMFRLSIGLKYSSFVLYKTGCWWSVVAVINAVSVPWIVCSLLSVLYTRCQRYTQMNENVHILSPLFRYVISGPKSSTYPWGLSIFWVWLFAVCHWVNPAPGVEIRRTLR